MEEEHEMKVEEKTEVEWKKAFGEVEEKKGAW